MFASLTSNGLADGEFKSCQRKQQSVNKGHRQNDKVIEWNWVRQWGLVPLLKQQSCAASHQQ
jgi:hypothetical protein